MSRLKFKHLDYNWKEIKDALNDCIPIMPIATANPWRGVYPDFGCIPLPEVKEKDYVLSNCGRFSYFMHKKDIKFKIPEIIQWDEEEIRLSLLYKIPVVTIRMGSNWKCIPITKFIGLVIWEAQFYSGVSNDGKAILHQIREDDFQINIERAFPGSYPEKKREANDYSCITNSDILTKDGIVKANKIRCGDIVYTNRNRYRPITEVQIRDVAEIELHTIKTKDGNVLDITFDHPIFIDGHWIDVDNINHNDLAAIVNSTKEKTQKEITSIVKSVHRNVRLYNFIVREDMSYVANGFVAHSPN